MRIKRNFIQFLAIPLVLLVLISILVQCKSKAKDTKLKTKISGTIEDEYYVSPGRLFKIKIPVVGEFGGIVEDKGNDKEPIFVCFRDNYSNLYVYFISSYPTEKSCEYDLEKSRTSPTFQGEEKVETPRGTEIWTYHIQKEGGTKSYRKMLGNGKMGELIKTDLYLTRTCLKFGNRVYLFMVGVNNTMGTIQYNNKEKLFQLSKEKLEEFISGFVSMI